MRLIINIDASHNCSEDGKGHMCISASIDENNGYFFAQSCKIRHVTLSSSETEYTAVSIGSTNIVYLRRLLGDITGFLEVQPTMIYEDNSSCIKMLVGNLNHRTSKHIRIKYHHVKELIKEGDIQLIYKPTKEMITDVLTKPLPATKHAYFAYNLLNYTI